MAQEFTFTVNGVERTTTQNKPLLRYLRDDLHIHSAKDGCSEGACGTCTIHVDGAAVKACVLTTALASKKIRYSPVAALIPVFLAALTPPFSL